MIDFSEWLRQELINRDMSQAELSRSSQVSEPHISRLLAGSKPGEDTCQAIAHAFGYPPETVFRAAGILPPARKKDARKEMILHLADQLPDEEYDDLLAYIEMRIRRAKEKGRIPDATATPKPAG